MKANKIVLSAFIGTIVAVIFMNLMLFIQDPLIYYTLLGIVCFVILIYIIRDEKNEKKEAK